MKSLKQLAPLLLLLPAIAIADINKDFEHIIQGPQSEISPKIIDLIYSQFLNEFQNLPSQKHRLNQANRKELFGAKLRSIIDHNQDQSKHYKKGINQFSDMTFEEVKEIYNIQPQDGCYWPYVDGRLNDKQEKIQLDENENEVKTDLPSFWDWRDYGVVSPVKNQGECGSCWAFSTVAAMEARYKMRYGEFKYLSEQQLVDCAWGYNNHGCDGGLPSNAYQYLTQNGGLTTESQYDYKGVDQNCTITSEMQVVGVRGGSVNLTQSEDELRLALFMHGPINVLYQWIDDFSDYKSGVYHSADCKSDADSVNHAVIAVGYGTEDGMDYWLCKNSYGTEWGDNGYFKIQRGVNMCGINNCNSYPVQVYDIQKEKQVFLY